MESIVYFRIVGVTKSNPQLLLLFMSETILRISCSFIGVKNKLCGTVLLIYVPGDCVVWPILLLIILPKLQKYLLNPFAIFSVPSTDDPLSVLKKFGTLLHVFLLFKRLLIFFQVFFC